MGVGTLKEDVMRTKLVTFLGILLLASGIVTSAKATSDVRMWIRMDVVNTTSGKCILSGGHAIFYAFTTNKKELPSGFITEDADGDRKVVTVHWTEQPGFFLSEEVRLRQEVQEVWSDNGVGALYTANPLWVATSGGGILTRWADRLCAHIFLPLAKN